MVNFSEHMWTELTVKDAYSELGYGLLFPADIQSMTSDALHDIASGVTSLFDVVYSRDSSRSTERIAEIMHKVGTDAVRMFVLLDDNNKVTATTSFIESPDTNGPRSYEAGRMIKHPDAPRGLAGDMIDASFLWAAKALSDSADYLTINSRVAQQRMDRPHNGQTLARMLKNTHALPTYTGYQHYVGPADVEPFVNATAPLKLDRWLEEVERQTLYLPDDESMETISALLTESTGRVPDIRPCSAPQRKSSMPTLYEITRPTPNSEAIYVTTQQPFTLGESTSGIPSTIVDGEIGSSGLSDRVHIEHDVVANQHLASEVYNALYAQGFRISGLEVSQLRYGRIVIVLGRSTLSLPRDVTISQPDLSPLDDLPEARRFMTNTVEQLQPRHSP